MNSVAAAVRDEVTTAISKDQLELPTLPEVALTIRETAERDDISAADLATVISGDPGLAARIVKVANSPMFRGAREIEDLKTAVSRLGIDYSGNIATGFAMRQMFQATSDVIDRKLRSVWSHATQVAAISSVLARSYTRLKPDEAMLAGLTHSIGVLPILTFAEENDALIRDSITLDAVIDSIHGELGTLILENWDFPPAIVMVPSQYDNYERDNDEADLVDLVTVANLEVHAGTSHPCTKLDWRTIKAFANLGLDPDLEANVAEDLSEDLQATMQALS